MKARLSILTALIASLAISNNANAEQVSSTTIPLVYSEENTGALLPKPAKLTADQMESCTTLPDPFAWSDGSGRSEDFKDWEKRRNEIKSEVEYYEIGVKPDVDRDQVTANYILTKWDADTAWTDTTYFTWNGQEYAWPVSHSYKAGDIKRSELEIFVTVGDSTACLTTSVTIPEGDGPFPVFISLGGSGFASSFPGCIQLSFNTDQVAKYEAQNSNRYKGNITKQKDQFNSLYPELYDNGNYSKWAWGVSRLIDGLEIANEKGQLKVDLAHIALSGCSYAGKMAMFCGAFDERVALTIAQEPGGGGASAWRTIASTSEKFGINVEGIGNTNYGWFMNSMKNFSGKQDILPHDHHEILAMCAPRALLVLGNPDMEWLCDYSTYITCRAAEKIYEKLGIADRFGFVIDGGHEHCSATTAETDAVKAFAAKYIFENDTVNTTIRTVTSGSSYPTLGDMEEDEYTEWFVTWAPIDPNQPKIKITEPASSLTYAATEVPESITFKATVEDANNDVTKVEFFVNKVLAKTVTAAPYEFELKDMEPGIYNVYAVATDATNLSKKSNTISVVVKTPEIGVKRVANAPKIDGEADDVWASADKFHAKNVVIGKIDDDNDLSGYVQLLWDETYIYAFATVFDDILMNDSGKKDVYQDDNIELYFDCNNSKGDSYDADDVQFSFNYGSTSIYTKSVGDDNTYSTAGIEFKIKEIKKKGYVVEAAIPWSTIKCNEPKVGLKIGFEFMIDDDDDGGDRDGKLAWNSTADNAWQSASSFGTVTLLGEGTAVTEVEELSIVVFPNPANDVLNVAGVEGEFAYQVFDVAGKVQLSGKAAENINVATLAKGIYVLAVITDEKTYNLRFVKQ